MYTTGLCHYGPEDHSHISMLFLVTFVLFWFSCFCLHTRIILEWTLLPCLGWVSNKRKSFFFLCLLFYPKFQACNFAPLLRNLEVTLFGCYVYLESCWGQLDGTLGLAIPLRKWKFHSSKPPTHFNSTVKYFNPLGGFSRAANEIFTVLWATNSEDFTVPTEEKGPHNHQNTKFLNSYQTSPIINQCTSPDGG